MADKTLARRTGEQGPPERVQFAETRGEFQIDRRRFLAESETRVEHDTVCAEPGRACDGERALQEDALILDEVGFERACATVVHQHRAGTALHDCGRHLRIVLQAPDIVDDMGAGRDRPARRFGTIGIDGNQNVGAARQRCDHRQHPRLLRFGIDRAGARPGRFAANIDDRGALRLHREGRLDRRIAVGEQAAVGKTVRRDVDDTHHNRLGAEGEATAVGERPENRFRRDRILAHRRFAPAPATPAATPAFLLRRLPVWRMVVPWP